MAISFLQFVVLLAGAAASVPPTGRWFSERENPLSLQQAPTAWVSAGSDVMCKERVGATFKLAIVYTELLGELESLERTLQPLYVETRAAAELATLLSSLRKLTAEFLLSTQYRTKAPVILWTIAELKATWLAGKPVPTGAITTGLTRNCDNLVTLHELKSITNFLLNKERPLVSCLGSFIKLVPTRATSERLKLCIEGVTSTMTWARHLVTSDAMTPAEIMAWCTETRPSFKGVKSYYPAPTPGNEVITDVRMREISFRFPRPDHVRCYHEKRNFFNWVVLNSLMEFEAHALRTTVTSLLSTEETRSLLSADVMTELHANLPAVYSTVWKTLSTKMGAITLEPTVMFVLNKAHTEVSQLRNLLTTTPTPRELVTSLQSLIDVIMTSGKICHLNANELSANLTSAIREFSTLMTPLTLRTTLKPFLTKYMNTATIDKLVRTCEHRFSGLFALHRSLMTSLVTDLDATSVTSPPALHFCRLVLTAATPAGLNAALPQTALTVALQRAGIAPHTPLIMVPASLLRLVAIDVLTHITPQSGPCAKMVAAKIAAGHARAILAKNILDEEMFLGVFTKKALPGRLTTAEMQMVKAEFQKLFLAKLAAMYTDEDILTIESITKSLTTLDGRMFERPVSEVLTPATERTIKVIEVMKTRCTENAEDLIQKTLVAIINRTPLSSAELETVLRRAVGSADKARRVAEVVADLLPEVTGTLLEEVYLLREYLKDVHFKNFYLIYSDLTVRVLSEACPVPLIHNMLAQYPMESPLTVVSQPATMTLLHKLVARLHSSLKAHDVTLPREELNHVTRHVMRRLYALKYDTTPPKSTPAKLSFDAAEHTLSVLGDLPLRGTSPRIIRRVASLAVRELEAAVERPECRRAARVKLMAGVTKATWERHLLTSSPESVIFRIVYGALQRDLPALSRIQEVTKVVTLALTPMLTEAMAGLRYFKDTETADKLAAELFVLPYERLEDLTLRELLVEPLGRLKTFYTTVKTCSYDEAAFLAECDMFYDRLMASVLSVPHLARLLTPVLPEPRLVEAVSAILVKSVLPEVRRHLATQLSYTRNALVGDEPLFWRYMGRTFVEAFGLSTPAPLQGILEHPLFEIFTTEIYKELLHKLTALKMEPKMAEELLNLAMAKTLEEVGSSFKRPLTA